MISRLASLALTTAVVCNPQTVSAITISFDYSLDSSGFFKDTIRRNILTAAANQISTRLNDNLSAISSNGGNQFNPIINAPNGSGSTQRDGTSIATNTLTVFVGAQTFNGSTVGLGGPGGFDASGSASFINTIKQRGQTGETTGPDATDFAPWGGNISFDSSNTWYFDNNTRTTEVFTGTDFYSVALHELGHVLGIGTSDSWNNLVINGEFTGASSSTLFGNNIALATDESHWREGTVFNTQSTAMDPSNLNGFRQNFTELDFAALKDIGWQVTPVPLPPAFLLFVSGLLSLFAAKKAKPDRVM